jgi:hypothetical protein
MPATNAMTTQNAARKAVEERGVIEGNGAPEDASVKGSGRAEAPVNTHLHGASAFVILNGRSMVSFTRHIRLRSALRGGEALRVMTV